MTRVKLSIHHACVSLSFGFNSAPCTQKTHTVGKTIALVYSSHVVTHQFKCCGADGKDDWSKSVGWENHEAVPDSCCVVKSDGCGQNKESAYSKVCRGISFFKFATMASLFSTVRYERVPPLRVASRQSNSSCWRTWCGLALSASPWHSQRWTVQNKMKCLSVTFVVCLRKKN